LPKDGSKAGVRWSDMPDIPPIMAVRMKLMRGNPPSTSA
jgi:hypothetical protein